MSEITTEQAMAAAAGMLEQLKRECEQQHARAEAAEQRAGALETDLRHAIGCDGEECPRCGDINAALTRAAPDDMPGPERPLHG